MDLALFTFIIFILFVLLLGWMFLIPLTVVLVNAFILYILAIRISKEIERTHNGEAYLLSAAASALLLLIIGNVLPLWWITSCALLTYLVAFLYHRYFIAGGQYPSTRNQSRKKHLDHWKQR